MEKIFPEKILVRFIMQCYLIIFYVNLAYFISQDSTEYTQRVHD